MTGIPARVRQVIKGYLEDPAQDDDATFGSVTTTKGVFTGREPPRAQANQIIQDAGVQPGVEVGVESGVSAGLSDAGALSSSSRIEITSESDANSNSSSGSGTKDDPYVIKDKDISGFVSSAGIDVTDGDGSYYIELKNCKVYNGDGPIIDLNLASDGGVFVTDCQVYAGTNDNATTLIRPHDGIGLVEIKRTHFAGTDDAALRMFNVPQKTTLTNCLIDDSQFGTYEEIVQQPQGDIIFDHVEITPSNQTTTHAITDPDLVEMYKSKVDNIGGRFINGQTSSEDVDEGTTFRNSVFTNLTDTALDLRRDSGSDRSLGNIEVGYCEFENIESRRVFIRNAINDPAKYDHEDEIGIHHCWSKDKDPTGTTGTAGSEPFETDNCRNVHITDSYVNGTVEDAFEHIDGQNCDIRRCVGLNVKDEIADLANGNESTEGGGTIAHIYGKCGGEAIRLAHVEQAHVHSIFAEVTGNSSNGDDDAIVTIGTCTNVIIDGPIPLAEKIAGDIINFSGNTTDSRAKYVGANGETTVSKGSPPSRVDEIR